MKFLLLEILVYWATTKKQNILTWTKKIGSILLTILSKQGNLITGVFYCQYKFMHVVISFKGFYDKKEKIDGYLGYHQFSSIYLRENFYIIGDLDGNDRPLRIDRLERKFWTWSAGKFQP